MCESPPKANPRRLLLSSETFHLNSSYTSQIIQMPISPDKLIQLSVGCLDMALLTRLNLEVRVLAEITRESK